MMKRMGFLAGAVVGYVFGARAGRQRYEQISALAGKAMSTPQAQKAKGVALQQVGQLTDQAKDKATALASGARSTVEGRVGSAMTGGRAKATGQHGGSGNGMPVTGEAGEQAFAPKTGSGYSI